MPSLSHPFPELRPDRPTSGITAADGKVPDGVTVFDEHYSAVTRLDADLRRALRRASTASGIMFVVNSGWRSRAYQQELFDQAVRQYGSESAAARWVARPGTSVHEAGDAVDLGPTAATTWLAEHGAAYGLCQIYANEPWHYELRPDAVEHGCPATYADPTDDPRMQR
jgi:LAS superfamily LD-carboxypeptidase LdcB